VREAQHRLYDLMLGAREQAAVSPVPVLVGVDDASLAEFGQWPWPRYRLAMLVDRLQQRGAEVVALDFLMPEPDRTSPGIIRAERRRDRADPGLLPEGEGTDENTARLADSLRRGKAALGYYLDFSEAPPQRFEPPPPALPTGTVLRSEAAGLARPQASANCAASRNWPPRPPPKGSPTRCMTRTARCVACRCCCRLPGPSGCRWRWPR
jgi:adenylate cyclase